jgi:alpha-beta hydrolase superfamily lysophospholipase
MGEKPIYLVGNSMGAILALKGSSLVTPAGMAMLSPGFDGHPKVFPLSYRIKTVIEASLNPNRQFELPYGVDIVTSRQSVRDWLENDPERRFVVPGRMLLDLLSTSQSLRWSNLSVSCSTLMLTAGQDKLVDNRASEKIFQRLKSPIKRARSFPSAEHDLTLEPIVDEVAAEIADWVAENSPSKLTLDSNAHTTAGLVSPASS